jgi:hypothetical protein
MNSGSSILISGVGTHLLHLRLVFKRLSQFGMVINLEKCLFAVGSFRFLGLQMRAQGTRPITSYMEAVEKRLPPTTVKSSRSSWA